MSRNNFFEQVSNFNKNVIGYVQPTEVQPLPAEVKRLSLIQLAEEIEELRMSDTATDEADALIDLVYFAYGALYKMGICPYVFDTATTIVHDANMTKAAGKKAARGYDGSAVDAVKPVDFIPPEGLLAVLFKDADYHARSLMNKEIM